VVDDVSPVVAAAKITVPVLLIHGAADVDTPAAHSQRVFVALSGPKRLILVPGAGHNQSLRGDVWAEIEQWVDATIAAADNSGSLVAERLSYAVHVSGRAPMIIKE